MDSPFKLDLSSYLKDPSHLNKLFECLINLNQVVEHKKERFISRYGIILIDVNSFELFKSNENDINETLVIQYYNSIMNLINQLKQLNLILIDYKNTIFTIKFDLQLEILTAIKEIEYKNNLNNTDEIKAVLSKHINKLLIQCIDFICKFLIELKGSYVNNDIEILFYNLSYLIGSNQVINEKKIVELNKKIDNLQKENDKLKYLNHWY